MRTHTQETQSTMTPKKALQYLHEGNERFLANLRVDRDLLRQVNETRDNQFPVATILSCIDSRTSAELIFDQGLGDIFSIRIAGTILNADILGSMEFACKIAGARAIVVLGHTKCGAIKGACDNVALGNLSTLLNKIQPSIYYERETTENRNSSNSAFVERVTEIQVRRSVRDVLKQSIILRELVDAGKLAVIGALYDIESGRVNWLEDTLLLGDSSKIDRIQWPTPSDGAKSG